MVGAITPLARYRGARLHGVGCMVFLKVLMTQHRPTCCASMESSLSPATMPCFLKNLPPLGYTFHLCDAMIIAPQTQYFCILCTQKPRERTHSRGFSIRSVHVLASAHEPVRQLIDTRLNLLSRSLRNRRAATNLTQLIMNHAVRLTRTNRPRSHILRQLIA